MQTKSLTLADSSTRTGTSTHPIAESMSEWSAASIFIDVTASSGDATEDLAISIRAEDPASGKTVELISDTYTDGATGTRAYLIQSGASDTQTAYQAIQATPLPKVWDVETTVSGGGAGTVDFTYSIGVVLHK